MSEPISENGPLKCLLNPFMTQPNFDFPQSSNEKLTTSTCPTIFQHHTHQQPPHCSPHGHSRVSSGVELRSSEKWQHLPKSRTAHLRKPRSTNGLQHPPDLSH